LIDSLASYIRERGLTGARVGASASGNEAGWIQTDCRALSEEDTGEG